MGGFGKVFGMKNEKIRSFNKIAIFGGFGEGLCKVLGGFGKGVGRVWGGFGELFGRSGHRHAPKRGP